MNSNDALRRDELLREINTDLHVKLGLPKENYNVVGMMVLYRQSTI